MAAARGTLGTIPLVGRGLNRVVWFWESASLRGERDLLSVFDTGTTRVYRSDVKLCLRNVFHGLSMKVLSGRSSKGGGIGRETVQLTSLDMLLNTLGFGWLGTWFPVVIDPREVGSSAGNCLRVALRACSMAEAMGHGRTGSSGGCAL